MSRVKDSYNCLGRPTHGVVRISRTTLCAVGDLRRTDCKENRHSWQHPENWWTHSNSAVQHCFSWVEKYCEVLEEDGQLFSFLCWNKPCEQNLPPPSFQAPLQMTKYQITRETRNMQTWKSHRSPASWTYLLDQCIYDFLQPTLSSDCNHFCQENGYFLNRDFCHQRLPPCTFAPRKFS